MIWVVGIPRTGTSMRVRQLIAGGATWPGTDPQPRDYNPHGTYEIPEVLNLPDEILGPHRHDPSVCLKAMPRQAVHLLAAGYCPAAALLTVRTATEHMGSWRSWFGTGGPTLQQREDQLAVALGRLAERDVPTLTVGFHDAIDHPRADAQRIADFLAPWVALDVDAMAAIPDPSLRHFDTRTA